jgi:hypothetical protein
MSPTDLEEILNEEPFRPFRITMSSGDQYLVNNNRRAVLSGLCLVLALNDDASSRIGNKLKLISVPNITVAEHVDVSQRPSRKRRRR